MTISNFLKRSLGLKMFKLFKQLILITLLSTTSYASYTSDLIVTSPTGIWVDSRAYASLNAAVTAVGANQQTIVIASQAVVTNLTVPANVTLWFNHNGSIANSGQLTLQTTNITAPARQIFTGAGDVDFASGTVVKSQWFSSLNEALTRTSDDTVSLLITTAATVTANRAVGDNVTLKWDSPALITVDVGITLSNISMISAPPFQLFAGSGDFDFSEGTRLKSKWFNRLRSALTWVEDEAVTIVISADDEMDFDTATTQNETLDFTSDNGLITVDPGVTFTIYSPSNIIADASKQIFSTPTTTNVLFTAPGTVHPDWWGVDGVADDVQLQSANDSITTPGGEVSLIPGKTYVVNATNSQTLLDLKYYAVKPSSNVSWVGGPTTIVKLADNQTAGGHDPGVFVTNASVAHITFEGFIIDLNGANNDCLAGQNVAAIHIGGDSASAFHLYILDMKFKNSPGLNFVVVGQSNSIGATLSSNIVVRDSYFHQSALDTSVTDHTSIYTWADHVRIENNFFENEDTNTNGWRYSTAWEFHGSDCIATGNIVKRYARGCYLGANYIADAALQIVDGNVFESITSIGAALWQSGANAKNLSDVFISDNTFQIYDADWAIAFGVYANTGGASGEDFKGLSITNNLFRNVGGYNRENRAIFIAPVSNTDISQVNISGNMIDQFVHGIYLSTGTGTLGVVNIQGNQITNNNPVLAGSCIGIYHSGSEGFSKLKVANNIFEDNQVAATFQYGIYLSGTISNIEVNDNSYRNLTISDYIESSLTYTTKKLNGLWSLNVAAEAQGGADTFIVTVTFNAASVRFGIISDLVGYFITTESVYIRCAHSGFLAADVMTDPDTSEIVVIGDVVAPNISPPGDPTAVGSDNQFTITWTNADDNPFTGTMSLQELTQAFGQIKTVTVANNQ